MANEDKIEQAVERAKGAAKEIAGKITGDARLEAEGKSQKEAVDARAVAGNSGDTRSGNS